MAKPEKVLTLAGIALADIAVLVSQQTYVPTLHLSKTSFWNGTKINQIRFGSYPDVGLIEIARAEALAQASTWDTWAFACVSKHGEKVAFLVEAGGESLTNIVRIIQCFQLPQAGFSFEGNPSITLRVQDKYVPIGDSDRPGWQSLLHIGASKIKTARDNWQRWNAFPSMPA